MLGLLIGLLFSTHVIAAPGTVDAYNYFSGLQQSQVHHWDFGNPGHNNMTYRKQKPQRTEHKNSKPQKKKPQGSAHDNTKYREQIRHRHIDKSQFDGCSRSNKLNKYRRMC